MSGAIDTTLIGLQTAPSAKAGALTGKAHGAMSMQRMRAVAQDFESVFISEMIRPMFENIEAEKPFGGGSAEDIDAKKAAFQAKKARRLARKAEAAKAAT